MLVTGLVRVAVDKTRWIARNVLCRCVGHEIPQPPRGRQVGFHGSSLGIVSYDDARQTGPANLRGLNQTNVSLRAVVKVQILVRLASCFGVGAGWWTARFLPSYTSTTST
jgi:hypothetical protein